MGRPIVMPLFIASQTEAYNQKPVARESIEPIWSKSSKGVGRNGIRSPKIVRLGVFGSGNRRL